MANQISKDKTRVNLALPNDLIKRLDGRAAEERSTRTAVMIAAAEAYLADDRGEDAAAAKLETIIAKLDGLASGQAALTAAQDAADAANRLAVAGILDAVRNQPIAVQEQPAELPPAEVEQPKKRGLLGLFGRG